MLNAREPTGTLELVGGVKHEGVIAFAESRLRVTRGGRSVTTGLDELVSLTIAPPENPPSMVDENSLLNGALPSPWRSTDMGRTMPRGKARWKGNQFVIDASPAAADEEFSAFHMVYQMLEGDAEIIARVAAIDGAGEDSHGGIVMAHGLDTKDHRALLSISAEKPGVSIRRWGSMGGSTTSKSDAAIKPPYWLRLVRREREVKAYHSPNGHNWRLLGDSPGKFWQKEIYVGLAARAHGTDRAVKVAIDHVSINGQGSEGAKPLLPLVVLASGSRLAADLVRADASSLQFRGLWENLQLTTPRVARVEFYHPLPAESVPFLSGERAGVLLRSGDFSEGAFDSLTDGRIKLGSLLFGTREFAVIDDVDALVFRKSDTPPDTGVRLETHAGSVLHADTAVLDGRRLVLDIEGLGELRFSAEEVRTLTRLPAP